MYGRICKLMMIDFLAALLLAGCGLLSASTTNAAATPVNLYLTFQPDVQFAPLYVGLEKGIFKDHGLDVKITHVSDSDAIRLVGSEKPQTGIHAAVVGGEQVLLARAQGIPVKYVFEWYQKFPVAIASKADKHIVTVNDLAGHSIGVPLLEGASYIALRALLAEGGLSESDVKIEATGFTQVQTLEADRVDAVVIYTTNEPIQLEDAGIEVNLINISDVVDLVSNGIVVSEDAIQNHRDLVRALDAAFSEALQYTIDHPDEAYTLSKKYVEGLNDPSVESTQRKVLERSIEMWKAAKLGESDTASWIAMDDVLRSMGLLPDQTDVNQAFTNDYLP